MIAAAGLVLVASALALVGTQAAAVPILWGWRQVSRRFSPATEQSWARWYPAVLFLPLALGLLLPVGAMMAACHCAAVPGPHLCPRHPELALGWVPHAVVAWAVFGHGPLRAMARLVSGALRGGRIGRLLPRSVPAEGLHLVDLDSPTAVTVGLFRPVVVADRGWWATLTPSDRTIVLAHEQAHVARRDLLTHAFVRALAAFLPVRLAGPLVAGWLDRAEQCADRHAANVVGDPLAVAELLIRQRRLGVAPAGRLGLHGGSFARRIHALAELRDEGEPLTSDLDGTLAFGLLAVPLLVQVLSPQLHGLAEATLRFLHF